METSSNIISVDVNEFIHLRGDAVYNNGSTSFTVEKKKGMSPTIYFKYIKKKFSTLEQMRVKSRLKKLEKAFDIAVENGQEALGEKMLREMALSSREIVLYAKGIRLFIEKEDLHRYKHKIRNGHISDTEFENYTRIIPANVLKKKKKFDEVFDSFVIYHYWNENGEDIKSMTPDERADMRDPVLFGTIKESNRLYFVADWEDEYCDLTFDEMVDALGKDEEDITLK